MDRNLIDATARGLIAPFMSLECGRRGRPGLDNRRVLKRVFWIARAGAPWRDLLDRIRQGNSVWQHFSRWRDAGLFEVILEALDTA